MSTPLSDRVAVESLAITLTAEVEGRIYDVTIFLPVGNAVDTATVPGIYVAALPAGNGNPAIIS